MNQNFETVKVLKGRYLFSMKSELRCKTVKEGKRQGDRQRKEQSQYLYKFTRINFLSRLQGKVVVGTIGYGRSRLNSFVM